MKKSFVSYINACVVVGLLCILPISCEKEPSPAPEPTPQPAPVTLTISPTTLPVAGSKGDTLKVEVDCSASWNVTSAKDWCKVSPSSGTSGKTTVTLIVVENTEYDERNTDVTFTAGNVPKKMTLTQKQKDALLLDSSEKVEVDAVGGNIQIKLRANIEYSYTIEEGVNWIHKPSKSISRGLTEREIELEVDENPELEPRQASVTIKAGEYEEKVMVYQNSSEPKLVLSQTDYVVASAGDTIRVELRSNSDYSYELPDVDWIKVSESRAMSSYTHFFEVLPNNTYDNRETQIKFVNKENGEEQFVKIKQMQLNAIVIAEEEYRFSNEKQLWELEVNTNIDFKAVSSADWMEVMGVEARGLEPKKVYVQIAANDSIDTRKAILVLMGKGIEQTIHVTQIGITDRIKLMITHEEKTFIAPQMLGYKILGTIDWGDGTQENYTDRRAYTYKTGGEKKATFDVYGAKSFIIDKLGSISSLTIYIDKDKNSSVEDLEIDHIEWD